MKNFFNSATFLTYQRFQTSIQPFKGFPPKNRRAGNPTQPFKGFKPLKGFWRRETFERFKGSASFKPSQGWIIRFVFILLTQVAFSQTTYVPDDNFEQALIDLGYDDTLDDYVLTANISGVTNLDVNNKEISYLTGIEDFTALTQLHCHSNQLTTLDISANTALTYLRCENNQLTSLDVSSNTALTNLGCHSNQLTSLDVSSNTALTSLGCHSNQLTSLDVSANTALTQLECYDNSLTNLDVSNNTALTYLNIGDNPLGSLDVSGNTALTILQCYNNQLTSLDVSNNTALTYLEAQNNSLTSLDVSANTALTYLNCNSNSLTSLDVSSNTALTQLNCNHNQLTSLDMSANTALNMLNCLRNELTSLNVSANTTLTSLDCEQNQLTSLDVSSNIALTYLECGANQLTSLDVSNNTVLPKLFCYENQLTSLDVSNNTALEELYVNNNQLTSLDVSANTALTNLDCYDNQLTSLDVSSNTSLFNLQCGENQLTSLDLSSNTALGGLTCGSNQLTSLDVSSNTALTHLECQYNQITALDVSNNTGLNILKCQTNQLTSLDVSSNTALTQLHCSSNQLTYLNMKNGLTDQLSSFSAQNNSLTCIETLDPVYATANWTYANENIDAGVTFDVICGAEARTHWYVATTGSDNSGSGTLASPLANIQTAINATTDGDTVSVAAGTYVENINFNGKNIAVIGADSSNTIIDGDSSGTVVVFSGTETSTALLKNFKIQNGYDDSNDGVGGIYCADGANPTLENLIVSDNIDDFGGNGAGGISVAPGTGDTLRIMGSVIRNNSGIWGGGGLLIQGDQTGVTLLTNVYIENNTSNSGGGIMIDGGVAILDSVTIMNNTAGSGNITGNIGGGGIDISNATLYLLNSTINNNSSGSDDYGGINGGGIGAYNSTLTIENTTLTGNTATGSGGGIYSENSSFTLDSVTVSNNTAQVDGGGICAINVNLVMKSIDVINNSCVGNGGGMYYKGFTEKTIISSSNFLSNHSTGNSGGIHMHQAYGGSDVIYLNTLIANNTSGGVGGFGGYDSWPSFYNVTIANNHGSVSGGLDLNNGSRTKLTNVIVHDNSPYNIRVSTDSNYRDSLIVNYSNISGGVDGINIAISPVEIIWGTGNIDSDPLFADTSNGDYTLLASSPAINAGSPNAFYNDGDGTRNDMGYTGGNGIVLSTTEFEFGYVAVNDSRSKTLTITNTKDSDISVSGASFDDAQFSASTSFPVTVVAYSTADITLTFTPSATGAHAGTLQLSSDNIPGDATYGEFALSGNAFDLSDGVVEVPGEVPTIQEAIDAASNGDTVLVSAGTYYENIEINGKYIALIGADSATTILDGDSTSGVLSLGYDNGGVSLIKRFTIQNGNRSPGGGIVINHSNAVLDELLIQNNESTNNGGAIIAWDWDGSLTNSIVQNNYSGNEGALNISSGSDLSISNVEISDNTAQQSGGGMFIDNESSVTMDNVGFWYNTSSSGDGGAFQSEGKLFARNCEFAGNTAGSGGAGKLSYSTNPESMFVNCQFRSNTAESAGGAVWCMNTNTLFFACRFLFNSAGSTGGAIAVTNGQTPNIINTTIAGNTASIDGGGLYYNIQSTSVAKIENSIIWGNSPDMISFEDNPGTYNESYVSIHYSDIQNGLAGITNREDHFLTWGTGNISEDPLFPSGWETNGNVSIEAGSGSPAIDAGNPNAFYNEGGGTRNDMGANGGNEIYISSEDVDFGNVATTGTCCTRRYIYNLNPSDLELTSYSSSDGIFYVANNQEIPIDIKQFEKFGPNFGLHSLSAGEYTGEIQINFANESQNNGTFYATAMAYDIPAGDIHVPADAPTIQVAIDIAQSGKTIVVAPGEYFENIIAKSDISLTSSGGPLQTIINGNNEGVVIEGHNDIAYNFTLDGFTITGGNGAYYEHGASAMYLEAGSTLRNLIITGNTGWGNVSQFHPRGTLIENVAIFDNVNSGTLNSNAAVYIHGDGNDGEYCVIKNVTIAGNEGMFGIFYGGQDNTHDLVIYNSVIWGNNDYEIVYGGGFSIPDYGIHVEYSLIEGGESAIEYEPNTNNGWVASSNVQVYWSSTDITSYPYFNDPDNGDYSLSSYSPMIGAGASSYSIDGVTYEAPDTDILGNARPNPAGTNPDIGAYESSESAADYNPHKYVATTGSNSNSGVITDPFLTIQYAIDQAQDDDIIHVAAGTYVENINYNGKNISVIGEDRETTIIDGNQNGSVVLFHGQEDSTALVKGFTIQNGSGYYSNSDAQGGGIHIQSSNPTLDDLIISNNILDANTGSPNGGGIMAYSSDGLSIKNTIIRDNISWNSGGGINIHNSTADLENVSIINNQTDNQGGGIYSYGSYLNLTNVLIADNYLRNDGSGSAIYSWNDGDASAGSLTIINCTVVNNTGGSDEILTNLNPAPIIYNSIIFGSLGWGAEYELYYSYCEQCDNLINYTNNPGNIDTYPAFADTANGDYHLSDLSPAISAGTDTITIAGVLYSAPTTDLDGNPRPNPAGTSPDMGAYESDKGVDPNYAGPVWYVDGPAGVPYGNGGPGAPFTTIQAGIDASSSGDTVSVKAGTYVENINFNGKNIAVLGEDRETTIIDGNQAGSVVTIESVATASLENLTMQNGTGTDMINNGEMWGGGIFIKSSGVAITNCVIKDNTAISGGAGIYTDYSSTLLMDGCVVKSNGIITQGSGAGINTHSSTVTIRNTLVADNQAVQGGGVYFWTSTPTLDKVTIINNSASDVGAGVFCVYDSDPVITNSIIRNNNGPHPIYLAAGDNNDISIGYSDISYGIDSITVIGSSTVTDLGGNIDVDPMFVDTASGDYHLLATSQLINAGHPDSTDSDGTVADISAYPYLNSYSGPTWYITEGGNDTTATGASDDPFRSIQAGINFSSDADSVTVAAGTYVENINFRGRNIKVVGADRETTIIDGNQNGPAVKFKNQETYSSFLSGFTIQNGNAYELASSGSSEYGGGGIYCDGGSSPILSNLTLKNNNASGEGAALYCHSGSSPKINDIVITENAQNNNISAISFKAGSNPKISGSLIFGNYGGINASGTSRPEITSSNIIDNITEGNLSLSIDTESGSALVITNSIIQINGSIIGEDSIDVSYSMTNDSLLFSLTTFYTDPMFVDTANGNYHLLASSQLINAGHPDSTDSDGTVADIGAYPYLTDNTEPVWYINTTGNDTTGTGTSVNPFASIQAGINFSSDTDSVTVAAGTYVENINFRGRNIKVVGADRETTIIDGSQDTTFNHGTGVVWFDSQEPVTTLLKNFTIQNGTSETGGGIRIFVASPTFENLIVRNNLAGAGGGVYIQTGNPVFNNVHFISNDASVSYSRGGSVMITGGSSPVFFRCSFVNNSSGNGGAVFIDESTPDFVNTTFHENSPNNMVLNTGSMDAGHAIVDISNSVFVSNSAEHIIFLDTSAPVNQINIEYSSIQGGQDSIITNDNGTVTWGDGNIDVDPMFVDTANSNYHLLASSQLINGGHPDSTDSDGSRADIGAYPYLNSYSGPTWYITEGGNDTTATGSSDDPFRSIQAGINFSSDADSVTVAAGTYVENINFRGRNIKVVGEDRETTIIDGNQNGSVVTFENGEDFTAVLSGFTITNGRAQGSYPYDQGGGIFCMGSDPVLTDLIISNNSALLGAGIACENSSTPTINNTEIISNTIIGEQDGGGGLFLHGSSSPIIEYVFISNNFGGNNGGGLVAKAGSNPILKHVTIVGNSATNAGGGIACYTNSNPILSNVTIVGNTAESSSGGISIGDNSAPVLTNTVLWNNFPREISFYPDDDPSSIEINYCDVQGGQDSIITNDNGTVTWGDGSIDVDPMFVDTANGDYSLTADSRCIDAGHPDSTDADGTISDMGAYYYDQAGQPVRVSNLITTPSADNVSVKWNANSAAASYNIYRSIDGSADFYSLSPYTTESDTSYVDETAADNTTYHYRVSAVDSESDEGILAYSEHGRTGPDSTALYMPDVYLSRTTPPDLDAGTNFTLEGFFRFLETPVEERKFIFLGWEVSVATFPDEAGTLLRLIHNESSYDGIVIGDTSWHHLALATDGSTTTLWVDGYAAAQSTAGFNVNGGWLQLGNPGASAQTIEMDEVRLSNVTRYSAGFIPVAITNDENTLGYWRFNEGSLDADFPTVYDLSGNGLHLELDGAGQAAWNPDAPVRTDTENAIAINEIMQNPSAVSDPLGEWVEIQNRWFTPVHLKDFILADDGTDNHTIITDVAIQSDGFGVFGLNADTSTNGGVDVDYELSGFSLGNSTDEVVLKLPDGTELDRVNYDNGVTFPDPSGASMELIAPHYNNAVGTNWTAATGLYGDGDLGSPGRRNDAFSGQIVMSDSTFNFGGIVSGEDVSDTLIISNMGVRRLMIDSITVSLPEYSLTPATAVLEIGDSIEILIAYAPNAAGVYNDHVRIYSDDPVNSLVTIPLYGVGISDVPDIIVMTADDDSLSAYGFPYTRIGSPRTFTFDVINIGAEDLEIDEIVISGDDNAFSVDVSSLNLELYDTTAVTVTFDPPTNGTYNATLSLTSNDPDEALYTIAFDGVASQYIIFYVPDEIATIQAALDSALAGDTIHVSSGTYGENLTLPSNDLVLRGAGADSTFLTGGDSSLVLTVDGGQSNSTIISDLTIQNGSGTNGGGMLIDNGSSPQLKNILFYDNSAAHGAALYIDGFSGPNLDHVTFVINSASVDGAGVSVAGGSTVSISNSIFWANTGSAIEVLSGSETTTYSIVEGGNGGTGNLDQNPLFAAPASADFHLQWGSPAIDSGDPVSDSDPDGTNTDMGVYYYDQSYQPPNAPTGLAFTPAAADVTLQWTANPEVDLTGYIIYKGLSTDQLDSLNVVSAPNNTYSDLNIDPAAVSYYQIAAVDTSQLLSERSDILTVSYPLIATNESQINFGSILFGTQGVQIMSVQNMGSMDLTIDSIYVEDQDHFIVSVGGRVLLPSSGTHIKDIRTLSLSAPENSGRSQDNNSPNLDNSIKGNDDIKRANLEEFSILPGDSLEITVSFSSPDTGSYTTNLFVSSDDPVGNNLLSVELDARSVSPEISLTKTMSVVTFKGNDIPFNIAINNPGGWPLDYDVEVDADWFGFQWMDVNQPSGQVPGFTTDDLEINVANTSNIDPGALQGFVYFNTNTGGDPTIIDRTDTISVYMNLLADGSQITEGSATIPSGNASPIDVTDDQSQPIGLVLDFLNSQGGTVSVTRIDAHPPSDDTTPYTDPSSTITDPIFARKYFEISDDFSASFTVDVAFDYKIIPGILDPTKLRLAKRVLNAGVGETWNIISSSQMNIDETNGYVIASNQTSFSQWAMLSNVGENTFIDVQAPVVSATTVTPTSPSILGDITVAALINDETGVDSASLYFQMGGASNYTDVLMTDDGSGSFSAVIPGANSTINGLSYYVNAKDVFGYSGTSDTGSIAIRFPDGALTSSMSGSAYQNGIPRDKWRLVSTPAQFDDAVITTVTGLPAPTPTTWNIFSYNGSNWVDAASMDLGSGYWIYQMVNEIQIFPGNSGVSSDLTGYTMTLQPGWNVIGSPYTFPINIALNQSTFYGPITYAIAGESWTAVETELAPWNGYAVYNRTADDQIILLDPLSDSGLINARMEVEYDWSVQLVVSSGIYSDRINHFGNIVGADHGLDIYDNPEIRSPGDYISLSFNIEDQPQTRFTTDYRKSDDENVQVWDIEIESKGLSHNAVLEWVIEREIEDQKIVQLVDLQSKTVIDIAQLSILELGKLNKHYTRKLKAVAGYPDDVNEKVSEILASIPDAFSLQPNYPNPFNPVTNIRFGLPEPRNIRLTVVNILGQEVLELSKGWQDLGFHTVQWNGLNQYGKNVSAGMYFAVLTDGKSLRVQKMLLLK